jgi:hypothetical protein
MKHVLLAIALATTSLGAAAQPALRVKPLAEKKVAQLPSDPLYWRIENFGSIGEANEAGNTPRGKKVAELGPIPRVAARPGTAPTYRCRSQAAARPTCTRSSCSS